MRSAPRTTTVLIWSSARLLTRSLRARWWAADFGWTIAGSYAVGVAAVSGWDRVTSVQAVYYFALQWVTASMIRLMVLRVAAVVDGARESAELGRQVQSAVHDFERVLFDQSKTFDRRRTWWSTEAQMH